MLHRRSSSVLDIEAAKYFMLDPDRLDLLTGYSASQSPPKTIQKRVDEKSKPSAKKLESNQTKLTKQHGGTSLGYRAKFTKSTKFDRKTSSPIPIRAATSNDKHSCFAPSIYLVESSTTSTNSLPSISSSRSVSPSLVCPHLSLDDILEFRNESKSPHTIGLCEKCRFNPPPNIHSPLSPVFKPSMLQEPSKKSSSQNANSMSIAKVRRGYSDQQVGIRSSSLKNSNSLPQPRELRARDDSLDYYLEPADLRRLEMSPTLRNSVEFIRKNPTETARVLIIYKNGQPFDRPLRISITRGEFATLNQLLDHINSRQLIQSGARYLFHIDGQLVYSTNELKHGSVYVVSGVRSFDYRANKIIKEQQRRQNQLHQLQHERQQRQLKVRRNIESRISGGPKLSQSMNFEVFNSSLFEDPINLLARQKSSLENIREHSLTKDIDPIQNLNSEVKRRQSAPKSPTIKQASNNSTLFAEKDVHQKSSEIKVGVESSNSVNDLATRGYENPKRKIQQRHVSLVRAKSELTSSPNKRKKNVTFEDTSGGTSFTIDQLKRNQSIDTGKEESTNIVEHALSNGSSGNSKAIDTNEIGIQVSNSIDGFLIDLPLPMPAGDKEKNDGPKTKQMLQFGAKKEPVSRPSKGVKAPLRPTRRKIVTITERQLSNVEMDKFKDLDHGDHHHELNAIPPVTIELNDSNTEQNDGSNEEKELIVPDWTNTISIGEEPGDNALPKKSQDNENLHWQYPGGREASTTPTERPVSQNEPSESVRAKVTTPTPSLSTVGDSNSLTMSYDTVVGLSYRGDFKNDANINLPPKRVIPVTGKLSAGISPPKKNFTLTWVNGFTINDKYPENSANILIASSSDPKDPHENNLSPVNYQKVRSSQFKPSNRFHNWICHSRLHDELIYPAGKLIVLWCRWTNEQRYYSKHTSNVVSISLSSFDLDLAASAQTIDSVVKSAPSIHLWSLTSLETVFIIDDNQLRGKTIYSLKFSHSKLDVGEMAVSAVEDKRLWLYLFKFKLDRVSADIEKSSANMTGDKSSLGPIKVNVALQTNQMPLLIAQIPSVVNGEQGEESNSNHMNDVIVSFGQRHFQIWTADRKKQKLLLMDAQNKSSIFMESMKKATCMIRIAPTEFLIGDASGNISSVLLDFIGQDKKLFRNKGLKYNLHAKRLICLNAKPTKTGPVNQSGPATEMSISCLCRISGSLFASGDSSCTMRFWEIDKLTQIDDKTKTSSSPSTKLKCRQLGCINLPRDLGFICTIILSKYSRKQSLVEFYIISTSNAILFGSVQLKGAQDKSLLNNCSLSVVYEGHETSVMNLVSDYPKTNTNVTNQRIETSPKVESKHCDYFTCSLDCKICKWSGKDLIWKSMLPSACASLAVHPTGFVLAIGSADGTVYILDKFSGLLISYFPLTPVCINCLAYSHDGVLLAAGCANGSIFILPVYERGLKYKKVSIFQSPYPVVSLQFSLDNRYILTSVTNNQYQELVLWDLPNFRYMRDDVRGAADKILWFDPICSGSEDVRAIWENANLESSKVRAVGSRLLTTASGSTYEPATTIINLSCHRLVQHQTDSKEENLVVASDTNGFLRLFHYPCYDIQQGFYEVRLSSEAINCCRFIALENGQGDKVMFVSSSLDGSICLWTLN